MPMTPTSAVAPSAALTWRAEVRLCPVCGKDRYKVLGRRGGGAHRAQRGQEATIVRCRACHLVYPRPFLLPSSNPYLEHERDAYFASQDRSVKREAGTLLARHAERLLGRKGRLLELGCGRGDLLAAAAADGWVVRGIEWTAAFADGSLGVEIEVASIETATSLGETHDVIYLAAILEHLYEPAACLRRVHDSLAPGGLVFIDVPNECGLWSRLGNMYMRLRGRDWVVNLSPTFPPFHVVGFCPVSLRRLLESTGFEILEFNTHRWQNEMRIKQGLGDRVEAWGLDIALSLGVRLKLGAGITCWARRRR
jgi:SAM-dependent methyltransferase